MASLKRADHHVSVAVRIGFGSDMDVYAWRYANQSSVASEYL